MTTDPVFEKVLRKGCPKCGSHLLTPTMHPSAECDTEVHMHVVCDSCLHTWEASI